jgi:hemerythrin-like domain-containing protein
MNPIQMIKHDHRTVKGLFRRFAKADRHSEKQRLGQEIIEELSVHAVIEERLIYPVLRARGQMMEEAVLNALEEHHAVKLVLAELDDLSADHERYDAKMHVVSEAVEMHIEEEESKLLPRLDAALDSDDRRMLAESMLELKRLAPNHPHPSASDTPSDGAIAALLAKVADSGRDVLRKITSADKAAGHRRVVRRAATGRAKKRATRGTRRRSTRASTRRSAARGSRARKRSS